MIKQLIYHTFSTITVVIYDIAKLEVCVLFQVGG